MMKLTEVKKLIRPADLVVALYIFGIMTAELMGAKTFVIGSLGDYTVRASVAIFLMPLLFTLTDVVTEVRGRERARSMVLTGLAVIVLLIFYTTLATSLPPSARSAGNEASYDSIFHDSIRMSIASLIAFASSAFLDIAIFAKLRARMHKRALWFRNNASNFVSQFVDSAVFLTAAFYALNVGFKDNLSFIIGLLIPYWLLRCGLSLMTTPLVYAGVRFLRTDKSR
ncbi:queuosine precursor transporter [Candidatus Saccharibacteria bacterium]|nr:MAG: queuosine precursor transporter [Candidatus Saccharibacteria bacterium]